MRSLNTQLTLATIAASVTARIITKSETKSVSIEEDAGSSNIYYVGCELDNAISDCTMGITDTGCMEGDATCSNGVDLGGGAGVDLGGGANEPTRPLIDDRSNLINLTPGICESILAVPTSSTWRE